MCFFSGWSGDPCFVHVHNISLKRKSKFLEWTRLLSFHDDSFLSAGATEMSLESGQRLLAITLVLSAFQSSNNISAAGSWSSAQKTSNRSLLSLQRFQPGELTWCFDTKSWRSMSCIFMISVSPWNLTFPFWHILFITPDLFDVKWVKKEKFNFKVMLKSWKYKSHVFRRNRSFYRHEPSHVIVIAHGPGVDILHILDNRETEYITVLCPTCESSHDKNVPRSPVHDKELTRKLSSFYTTWYCQAFQLFFVQSCPRDFHLPDIFQLELIRGLRERRQI